MEQKLTKQNETFGSSTLGNVKIDKQYSSVLNYMDAYEKTDFYESPFDRDYL